MWNFISKWKIAKHAVYYPGPSGAKGGEFLRLPDTAPGPTKIIVPDMPVGEEDRYNGGAARAQVLIWFLHLGSFVWKICKQWESKTLH